MPQQNKENKVNRAPSTSLKGGGGEAAGKKGAAQVSKEEKKKGEAPTPKKKRVENDTKVVQVKTKTSSERITEEVDRNNMKVKNNESETKNIVESNVHTNNNNNNTGANLGIEEKNEDETDIKVIVRARPLNQRELSLKSSSCLTITETERKITLIRKDKENKSFYFDEVFGENSTQKQIYDASGAKVLERFILGYNACIFAYGQTSSGKTYTMEGIKGNEQQEGIMTRFVRDLFQYVKKQENKTEITIKASYCEIYNETINDLLATGVGKHKYEIREDKIKGTYITNIIERPIESEKELNEILEEGSKRRTVAETKMNEMSSRSHAILTIHMEQFDKGDEEGFSLRTNKISLVDLAGSERASSTEATGDRLKEGAKINLSLSNLGNVINALVKGTSFVPYRSSCLTRLLKDSLGGNSFTLMISCISPAEVNAEETLSTLYFADRAKQIKNKLKISRGDPRLEKINELLENEKRLKARIEELEKKVAYCEKHHGSEKKGCCTVM
ncbi:hypothetical protein FDP41_010993 [Naegleria fowleri]|uniref:Kinesin motor domain-containing protein n=1 Tax=Naegleria fowleri TaxID=5763 RepID=A0A6A5CCG1_NAEFO|nr:uncharacterized protein FDP41_010993 [Naegleria fowleri]KAF0983015.1 hypothetical protein FDP41_010993 [Naegleria fowleri]